MRNEPNSRRRRAGRGLRDRGRWFRTNKANSPMRPEMGAGWRSLRLGRLRQTNPICPAPPERAGGGPGRKCCCRWGQARQTKPIWSGASGLKLERQMRETKPICTPGTAEAVPLGARRPERQGATVPRPPSLEPIMRNEPNFHRDCGRDTPLFHHSIVPGFQSPAGGPGGIAPNEANSGARPIVRNEANLRQGRVGRGRRGERRQSLVPGATPRRRSSRCWEILALRGIPGYDDASQ